MLLRSQLEKLLPAKSDEQKLTAAQRRMMFRGGYIGPIVIESVKLGQNFNNRTKDAYPSEIQVTRTQKNGTHQFAKTAWRGEGLKQDIDALNTVEKLARANRIERLGRRIKACTAGIATIVVAAAFIAAPSSNNSGDVKDIKACEKVVTGEETLTPVSSDDLVRVEQAGGTICELAGEDYLVVGQN